MYPPDRCHSFLDRDFLHISGTLITCLWTGWFAAIRRLFRLQQISFPCLLCINMNQRYIAFSFRTMTFVMFCIYFTFIFAFLWPIDALSTYINTAPALLYTLLLSSSQSWGWVSQIRLCQVEAAGMKSGVTPVCHSFSCMLFSFLRPHMLFVFVFARMLFAFLTYCMLRIPVSLYAICFSYSYLLFVFFYTMLLLVRRGAKKSRLLGGVMYLLLCCTDVSTVVFSIE